MLKARGGLQSLIGVGMLRWVFLLVGLAACSSAPPRASLDTPFHLVFSAHRMLELEPCGCTLVQLGGVDREANALKAFRSNADGPVFVLSAGTTFVPDELPKGATRQFLKLKRDTLVEAMNALGVQALAPSGEDASLGIDELKRLATAAKFPFLSANLVDKNKQPIFPSHQWFSEKEKNILLIGLASPPTARYPLASAVTWVPPRVALQEVFAKLDHKPDRVVVLAPFASQEVERLGVEFPRVQFFLGGLPVDASTETAGRPTPASLQMASVSRGRGMVWIRSDLAKPMTKFYSEATAKGQRDFEDVLKNRVARLETEKGAEYEQARKDLALLQEFPSEPNPNWVQYETGSVPFTPPLAEPTNALTDLVKGFRSSTRRLAVDGD